MSNDFLNHLDAREKELWAELEKIDATRKLWQEPQQTKTVQRKEVRPVVGKAVKAIHYTDTEGVLEYLGGMQRFKQCARIAHGRTWLSLRSHGKHGYRVALHDFGSKSRTGKTAKSRSYGNLNYEHGQYLVKNLLNYFADNKHNN